MIIFFSGKKYNFRLSKCIKLYIFPENLKKNLGFISKFRKGRVTLSTGIVIWPYSKLLLTKAQLTTVVRI